MRVYYLKQEIFMDLKYNFKPRLIRRITYISHVNKKRGYSHCDHVHYRYGHEIIYLDYGRMDITLDGKMFRLNAGEIIFIKGGVHHSFKGRDELPFDYLNAMFRGTLPERLFNKPLPVDRKMWDILLQLKHESEFQEDGFLEMSGSLLTELAVLLIRQTGTSAREKSYDLLSNRLHYESDKVEKACEIIRKNYNISLKEEDVAKAIRISASHLRLLLRKNTGKNFKTLLHECRIEAAKHFIREEGRTFSEIALQVGFETPSFFFRLFKRHTGMSPKEYARSLG